MRAQKIKKMPEPFEWNFLFNLPEYIYNKRLISEDIIPHLPLPRKITNNQQLGYSAEDLTLQSAEYSDNQPNISPLIQNGKEYSPDPYDIDMPSTSLPDTITIESLFETMSDIHAMITTLQRDMSAPDSFGKYVSEAMAPLYNHGELEQLIDAEADKIVKSIVSSLYTLIKYSIYAIESDEGTRTERKGIRRTGV